MKPEIAAAMAELLEGLRAGDTRRIGALFEGNAILHAPFLSEPLRGWMAIEGHLLSYLLPNTGVLEAVAVQEMGNKVMRQFRSRILDRDGFPHDWEGSAVYTFNERFKITEVELFLDERNLRLMLLRRP